MGYARKAAKSTIIVFVISIAAAFLGYLIRMVLARKLTPADYGLFFAVFTFVNFISIFKNLGLTHALVKYIPDFQVKKKLDSIKSAIVTVLGVKVVLSLIFALGIILFSGYLADHYFKNKAAVPLLFIFALIIVIQNLKETLKLLFNAFQKMTSFSFMYFIENLTVLTLIILFSYLNLGVLSPALAYLSAYLFVFVLFFPIFLKTYNIFRYKTNLSSQLTKKLFKFGILTTLAGVGGTIILYTDTLILTHFSSLEEVGIYNVVVPTAMLLDFFGKSVGQVIFPMVSELHAKKLKKYISKGALLLQKYSFIIVIPAALIMFSFPRLIIKTLFGAEYISGALTLQLLVIGLIFLVIAKINMTLLRAIDKPELGTKMMLIGGLFNLLTNFYFIPKFGMVGAGITSLASYLLTLIVSIFYLTKHIEIKTLWFNWLKIFLSGIIFIGTIDLIKNILDINIFLEATLAIFLGGIVYLFSIWLFRVVNIKELRNVFGF